MLFPRAKIIFATSTAVLEDGFSYEFKRHNSVIEKYNEAALCVLSKTDTVINDLYTLTTTFPDSYRSDWVHFYTPKATELIGGRVLSIISELLNISPTEINIDDFVPEKYSKKNIGY